MISLSLLLTKINLGDIFIDLLSPNCFISLSSIVIYTPNVKTKLLIQISTSLVPTPSVETSFEIF